MDNKTKTLLDLSRQLECMAVKLGTKAPPGHCDYINKTDAAAWAETLAKAARKAAGDE